MTIEVTPTPRDKGLQITLVIGDYDNGIISINGEPTGGMGGGQFQDRATATAAVMLRAAQAMQELFRQADRRKREQAERNATAIPAVTTEA